VLYFLISSTTLLLSFSPYEPIVVDDSALVTFSLCPMDQILFFPVRSFPLRLALHDPKKESAKGSFFNGRFFFFSICYHLEELTSDVSADYLSSSHPDQASSIAVESSAGDSFAFFVRFTCSVRIILLQQPSCGLFLSKDFIPPTNFKGIKGTFGLSKVPEALPHLCAKSQPLPGIGR